MLGGLANTLLVRIKGVDEFSGTFKKVEGQAAGSTSALKTLGKQAAIAGITGAAVLGYALADCVKEAMEAEKVTAQTNSVLKSTGNIANVSAKDVDALASAIQNKSGIDDETVKSGENLLLTFTNIRNEAGKGNDIFNQSTNLMADLSVRFGMDMPSAAKMMGKALNDPMKGLTALSRAGVQFSAGQKEQIENFVAAGDLMSAQKVILAELTTQVGGAAEAYGNTFAGKIDILKSKFGDVKETIGTALIPALSKAADALIKYWPQIQKAAEGAGRSVAGAVSKITSAWALLNKLKIPKIIGWLEKLNKFNPLNIVNYADNLYKAMKPDKKTFKDPVDAFKSMYKDMEKEQKTSHPKMTQRWNEQMQSVVQQIVTKTPMARGKQEALMNELTRVINTKGVNMRNATGQQIMNMAQAIAERTGVPVEKVQGILQQMTGKIDQKDFNTPGKGTVDRFSAGVGGTVGTAINAANSIAAQVASAFGNGNYAGAGNKAGSEFGNSLVGPAIEAAKQVAAQVAAILGNSMSGGGKGTGGGVYATGGEVQQFASGGGVGKPVPAILHTGEYVVRRSAVQKVGVKKLDAINRGASPGGGGLVVNINAGAFAGSQAEARRFASWLQKYLTAEGAR